LGKKIIEIIYLIFKKYNYFKMSKNYKISVHIPLYLDPNKKTQLKNFNKVCKSFLSLTNKTKLFIHSNKKFKDKKNIKYYYYNFKKIKRHPSRLTWFCRNIMEKQKNNFDIFIYCEDDVLFTNRNFNYWLNYKDLCLKNNYNLGFTRCEIKNKIYYSSDQVAKSRYYVNLLDKKFIVPDNPHCAFWIYDKKEFNDFVNTKYWKFNWRWVTISGILLIREMATIGWHGINMNGIDMNRYLATIIPLEKDRIDPNSFVKHLSNKFSKNPAGLFGTFKVKDILEKELIEFKPSTSIKSFIKRIKYILYHFSRINIKKYIKALSFKE